VALYTTGDSTTSCKKRWIEARPHWPPTPEDEATHVAWAFEDLAHRDVDVIHTNSALGVPLSRFARAPVVHTIHHRAESPLSRLYAAHQGVAYVAISRRQLELETPLADVTVIHHGLSPERYPESEHDSGYLLHLGRYAPEKGTHLAIDVARAAGLPLVLAGRAHAQDAAYFAERVAPRLRQSGVEEVGEADHARKVALLRGARALLCPLQWEEPFGLVAIEAMLCGTPVVGFARGSYPEIVEPGVTGLLAPADDVSALLRKVGELDGLDRRACARRARERFSTAVMAGAYEQVYARVAMGAVSSLARSRRSSAGR
jgi:glycosyltransferase involved in cell wall biosynthesis